jgi:uncharacterized membrane protein
MKMALTLWSVAVVVLGCSVGQAFEGRPPRAGLENLPAEKEMLFHQTMRGVRDSTKAVHEQIKALETEIKDALRASEFDAASFLEKTKALRELHQITREAMDQAMAVVASRFTAEERAVLADLMSRRPAPPPGLPPGR